MEAQFSNQTMIFSIIIKNCSMFKFCRRLLRNFLNAPYTTVFPFAKSGFVLKSRLVSVPNEERDGIHTDRYLWQSYANSPILVSNGNGLNSRFIINAIAATFMNSTPSTPRLVRFITEGTCSHHRSFEVADSQRLPTRGARLKEIVFKDGWRSDLRQWETICWTVSNLRFMLFEEEFLQIIRLIIQGNKSQQQFYMTSKFKLIEIMMN